MHIPEQKNRVVCKDEPLGALDINIKFQVSALKINITDDNGNKDGWLTRNGCKCL